MASRRVAEDLRRKALRRWFSLLGESDPDFACDEESESGVYLARALLLRGIARCVSSGAVDRPARMEYPGGGDALARLIAGGASKDDLRVALQAAQWESIWQLVCLLDDSLSGIDDLQAEIDDHVQWRVFRVNEDGQPVGALGGLHEDLLEVLPRETTPAKPGGRVPSPGGKRRK